MSYADRVFKENLKDILENGSSTEGQKVRPHWEDGTPAYTIKQFGVANTYDLRKEFPAITIRRTALKSCMDEILWIFQRKSNNIKDLKSHIWDEWADKNGSIGKAYGYQINERYIHHTISIEEFEKEYKNYIEKYDSVFFIIPDRYYKDEYNKYENIVSGFDFSFWKNKFKVAVYMDQMDAVLYDLKNNPFSRRIITNIFNMEELHEMNLQPCCWSCTFNVTDEGLDKLVLNMQLTQRSNDMIAANNWNVAQYAILLMMVAQVSDMIPGKLFHVITDQHIYDRHIDIAKELLNRTEHPAPKVSLNPNIKNFYDFTTDDLIVEDYVTEPQIKNIPIAI